MQIPTHPIGVIDSGIGGLTVVQALRRLLPAEDIIYFGDSANCPYGNRSEAEILALSRKMLSFMEEQNVKCVALACCTISSLAGQLNSAFSGKLISIVDSAAHYAAEHELKKLALIGTEFTVASGVFEKTLHRQFPQCTVIGKGSPCLAHLIESTELSNPEIDNEIRRRVGALLLETNFDTLLLGCTHYPIAEENFRHCFPALHFINPAEAQAQDVYRFLAQERLLSPAQTGRLDIYTSGDPMLHQKTAEQLQLGTIDLLKHVNI